ncbi:MAG: hypothetical protein A3D67_03380 [Candidatus Lloydbacteria bacterium RIFCSPHIGHO2_02_FULL_51_22]|uniref:Uncharacterized protein n=1 Tax=Candidatus Lloydbacteria bacterium RIFCSPHIGHO2_02_FULL_51_22 TaxID=1798663 RepID=A0A1G2DEV0_9BACT|nr:MAG: hypothetical protein A3D67_03380 [Candidatus Lloydbacteria bacterium RIFCSPHIGHO2_02_FULL_51_22]
MVLTNGELRSALVALGRRGGATLAENAMTLSVKKLRQGASLQHVAGDRCVVTSIPATSPAALLLPERTLLV